jgi:hypothetical protein
VKKVGDIMKEMGFNPDSSEATQKSFIKYLIRVANKGKHIPEPQFFDEGSENNDEWQELKLHSKSPKSVLVDKQTNQNSVDAHKHEQLCFDFKEGSGDSEAC